MKIYIRRIFKVLIQKKFRPTKSVDTKKDKDTVGLTESGRQVLEGFKDAGVIKELIDEDGQEDNE